VHIEALLDAAGELDRDARADQRVPRRAILSTLVFSGLRIGELIELRWRDVNLADGKITHYPADPLPGVPTRGAQHRARAGLP
jgi:integrase